MPTRLPEFWHDLIPDYVTENTYRTEVLTIIKVAAQATLGTLDRMFTLSTAEEVYAYLLENSSQEAIEHLGEKVSEYIDLEPDQPIRFVSACRELAKLIKRYNQEYPPVIREHKIVSIYPHPKAS